MKRIFILLTMLMASLPMWSLASEVSRIYYWENEFGYLFGAIDVNLNENTKEFVISYTYDVTNDILDGCTLSSGRYRYLSDNEIRFEDTVMGLTMVAITGDETLEFISSYGFLDNRVFCLSSRPYYEYDYTYLSGNNSTKVATKRIGLIKNDYSESLSNGEFVGGNGGLSLTIKGNRFRYGIQLELWIDGEWVNVDVLKVLQGTWSQDGNLIILHDEHTDHDFYLIYEEPNLRTMLLPGDTNLEGTVLTPQ